MVLVESLIHYEQIVLSSLPKLSKFEEIDDICLGFVNKIKTKGKFLLRKVNTGSNEGFSEVFYGEASLFFKVEIRPGFFEGIGVFFSEGHEDVNEGFFLVLDELFYVVLDVVFHALLTAVAGVGFPEFGFEGFEGDKAVGGDVRGY